MSVRLNSSFNCLTIERKILVKTVGFFKTSVKIILFPKLVPQGTRIPLWEFRITVYDTMRNCLFLGILNSSSEAGDSRIDRDGTIHTRPVKSWEIIIKQCIISSRKFTVRMHVILNTCGKGQINLVISVGWKLSGFISPGSTGAIPKTLKLEKINKIRSLLSTVSLHWLRLRRHVEV
jgi:hypothetical protein